MPFTITDEGTFLRAELTGLVTADDLHAMIDEGDSMARTKSIWPDNLIDIRAVDSRGLDFPAMMSMAKRRKGLVLPNPIRTACVAGTSVMLGFARMFQNLNGNPRITFEIFSTCEEAERWLTSPRG